MSEYVLNQEQLQEIATFLEQENYQSGYQVILDATEGTDYGAYFWFDNAKAINSGIGPASQFITTYMDVATQFGLGDDNEYLNDELYEQASDLIAISVLTNIIEDGGVLPLLQEIIDRDAAVAQDFLGLHPLEWGGTPGQALIGDFPFPYEGPKPENVEELLIVVISGIWAGVEAGTVGSLELLVGDDLGEALEDAYDWLLDQLPSNWFDNDSTIIPQPVNPGTEPETPEPVIVIVTEPEAPEPVIVTVTDPGTPGPVTVTEPETPEPVIVTVTEPEPPEPVTVTEGGDGGVPDDDNSTDLPIGGGPLPGSPGGGGGSDIIEGASSGGDVPDVDNSTDLPIGGGPLPGSPDGGGSDDGDNTLIDPGASGIPGTPEIPGGSGTGTTGGSGTGTTGGSGAGTTGGSGTGTTGGSGAGTTGGSGTGTTGGSGAGTTGGSGAGTTGGSGTGTTGGSGTGTTGGSGTGTTSGSGTGTTSGSGTGTTSGSGTGTTSGGGSESGSTGGSESGSTGGSESGSTGGSESGSTGGSESGSTGGSESGSTGGSEPGSTGGSEPGSTGGSEPGSTGGSEPGSTGGSEPGSTGGSDPGSTGGSDPGSTGGSEPGSTGGSESGSTGGSEPGSTGGSEPGSTGGSEPGSTGGSEPGSTGGSEPGSTGGSESGSTGGSEPGSTGGSGPGTGGGGGGGAGGGASSGSGGSGNSIPRDPLVLDLNGDGISFIDSGESTAYFDLNGDGFATKTSWLNSDDGFLVLDRNDNGRIDDIKELFGSPERTGYEELQELDSNFDGLIDSTDTAFNDLSIWKDENSDGISQSGEIRSLDSMGIKSVSLEHVDVEAQGQSDASVVRQGVFTWEDNSEGVVSNEPGIAADVIFSSSPTFTKFIGDVEIKQDALSVANIKGYGQMADLHIAMSLDDDILQYVSESVNSSSLNDIVNGFGSFVENWAGVSDIEIEQIDPDYLSNISLDGNIVEFRLAGESFTLAELGVIKAYSGLEVLKLGDGQWFEDGKIASTGGYYRKALNEIKLNLLTKVVVANGFLSDVASDLSYNINDDFLYMSADYDENSVKDDVSTILSIIKSDSEVSNESWLSLAVRFEIKPSLKSVFNSELAEQFSSMLSSMSSQELERASDAFDHPVFQLLDVSSFGGSNKDNITGGDSNDVVFGLGEDDTLRGGGGDDTLGGGTGNDRLYGDTGNDTVSGDDGNDYVYGNDGNDVLDGGAGTDRIYGGNGDDTLQGGTGSNDSLYGEKGSDTYLFAQGDGDTTIKDYSTVATDTDTLRFLEGIDPAGVTATRSSNDLLLTVSASGETVKVSNHFYNQNYQLEQVVFADGTVWSADTLKALVLVTSDGDNNIIGYAGADTVNGQGGNDTLRGGGGDDTLGGGTGNDRLYGDTGNDTVSGDDGNDYVYGNDGNDVLDGGAGTDRIYGGNGDDTLQGGTGSNDSLYGEKGSDTYLFAQGDGDTTIKDYSTVATDTDTLRFLEGIDPAGVTATRSSNDLLLTVSASGETVKVSNHFYNQNYQLEQVVFADGTVWSADTLKALVLGATEGADNIIGDAGADTVNGQGGNDTLRGGGGDDTLGGGTGNDRLYGDTGNDTVSGDDGNDYVYGNDGNDVLDGGAGTDRIYGGNGDDTLQGGTGSNDSLYGEKGSDTYLFAQGDGDTTIKDYSTVATDTDTLRFLEGIDPAGVTATRSSNDLLLTVSASGETVKVSNHFYNQNYQLEQVVFADGTVWSADTLKALVLGATEGADNIIGDAGADTVNGQGGNDTLRGGGGDDTLGGGTGNDRLYGDTGNDTVSGDDGNDYVYGNDGNDVLDGGAGTDRIYGGNGDDTLQGGTGSNDSLYGEKGSDTYLFAQGDGDTTIKDYSTVATDTDTLRFLEGIDPAGVTATRSSNDLLLTVSASGETVKVSNHFYNQNYQLEQVVFADGTVWSADTLKALVLGATEGADNIIGDAGADTVNGQGGNDTLRGGGGDDTLGGGTGNDRLYGDTGNDTVSGDDGNDYVYGNDGNDVLDGGAGTDRIYGGNGDDTLQGGTGSNDSLYGEKGSDTYLFAQGDGDTTIKDYSTVATDTDTLRFLEGIDPAGVTATRSSNDLLLTVSASGETVKVSNHFYNQNYQLEQVVFADGTVWSADTLKALVLGATEGADNIIGYAGADTVNGQGGNDTLRGGGGDDTLGGGTGNDRLYGDTGNDTVSGDDGNDYVYGNDGNDVLDGGAGTDRIYGGNGDDTLQGGTGSNDSLYGEKGSDTYLFAQGDGDTTIKDYSTVATDTDTLRFLEGIDPAGVTATRSSNDLLLTVSASGETVKVSNHFYNQNYQLEQVVFADGTVWSADTLKALVLGATEGADNIIGYAGADTVNGQGGNDTLRGGGGDDTLGGGTGNDRLYGDTGNDTVSGDDGNDYVYGNDGNDVLDGGAGTDRIYGGNGDDTLQGGTGSNDSLYGEKGSDTYLFAQGDGDTTIKDYSTVATDTDTLRFLEGIDPAGVTATRSSNDLLLTVSASGETVKVSNHFYNQNYQLEQVVFADGTVWSADTLKALVLVTSDGDNNIIGYAGADTVNGQGGNDTLRGGGGDDTLGGGTGNDRLYGDTGNDTVSGDDGNDYVYGNDGNDVLDGGAGTDRIYGGNGDDMLQGGTGSNDSLYGEKGSDTYLFAQGDGDTTIKDYTTVATDTDVLKFLGDISPEDLWFSQSGNNLKINLIGSESNDELIISNWYSQDSYQIERIETQSFVILNQEVDGLVDILSQYSMPSGTDEINQDSDTNEAALLAADLWDAIL